MPTIYHAGIEFDVAQADGEILDATLDCRDELAEETGWPHDAPAGMPHLDTASDAILEDWAIQHFASDVASQIDWKLMPLHEQYGVSSNGSGWHG